MQLKKGHIAYLSAALVLGTLAWYLASELFPVIEKQSWLGSLFSSPGRSFNRTLFFGLNLASLCALLIYAYRQRIGSFIARNSTAANYLIWGASFTLYIIALFSPLLKSRRFLVYHEAPNVFESISFFLSKNEGFIALLLIVFVLVFPLAKYILTGLAIFTKMDTKLTPIIAKVGKWSMLDVFVVAVIVVNFKMNSAIVKMEIAHGTVLFALAVLSSMAIPVGKNKINEES